MIGLLEFVDAPSAVVLAAGFAGLGAACFATAMADRRRTIAAVVAALALFGLGWANAAAEHPPLRPAWVKGMPEDLSRYDFVGWNTYSRVTVGPPVLEPPHLWAGSRLMPPELRAPVGQRTILIDGAAAELGAWLWGLNGAAGVCASALALACSMIWGVAVTLAVGAACYLVLLGCTRVLAR